MKNIANLKPRWHTLDEDFKSQKNIYRKNKALERWLKSNLPFNIKGKYSFDDVGESTIRIFIYLNPEDKDSVKNLIKWIIALKKIRFKAVKFFREENGYFAYKIQREYSNYNSYIILVEQAADLDGCVITQKRKMKTIYTTDCENKSVEL